VKTAEADGFGFAMRVKEKGVMKEALKKLVEFEGPAFLEVMIDPEACVYPMVGPGMGYKEMITGDFIAGRVAIEETSGDAPKPTNSF
jgi:acetolactate synthase-1/2/3 large subunit